MALTSRTAISSAFVLLEDQPCSCTEEPRARLVHSVFSALYKHVESDVYLLAWGVKLKPEGLKYRVGKELDVKLRNANSVTLEHSGCSEGKVKLFGKQRAK